MEAKWYGQGDWIMERRWTRQMVGWEGMKWAGGNRKGKDDKAPGSLKETKRWDFPAGSWEKNKKLRSTLPLTLVDLGM